MIRETSIKPVPGYSGYYADTKGNVYSEKGKAGTRKGHKNKVIEHKGIKLRKMRASIIQRKNTRYYSLTLCNENKKYPMFIHRIILETFVGKRPLGMQACHGSLGTMDNSLKNLSWGTASKNNGEDKWRDGTQTCGDKNGDSKLSNKQVIAIKKFFLSFPHNLKNMRGKRKYLSEKYKVSFQTIHRIKTGQNWGWLKI